MILLITKYNLSSRWFHLFTFLIFYLICLKMHSLDLNNNNFVECMMKRMIQKTQIDNSLIDQKRNFATNFYEDQIGNLLDSLFKHKSVELSRDLLQNLNGRVSTIQDKTLILEQSTDSRLLQFKSDISRIEQEMQSKLHMLEADCKSGLPSKIEPPEAIDTAHFVTVDQLTKSHQELYTNIENNFKKELSTVSTLQTELTNEISTRKGLETRVTNLEEELREIRRALMFRGTIMDPLVQHQLTLNEVKQTTQENSIASIPR